MCWCASESTNKNLPKSQLDIGILISNNIQNCEAKGIFLQVDETYINKRKKLKKEKPNNMNYFKTKNKLYIGK